MSDRDLTRRALLRRGTAAVSAGVIASVAGCGGLNPLGGGGAYTDWLPVPDAFDDTDHYGFSYFDMEAIESNEDQLDEDSFDPAFFESVWDPIGVDWEDTTSVISVDSNIVVEADFDRETAVGDLEDEDYEEDTDHEGYTIFLDPGESSAYAVGDSAIVVAGGYGVDDPVDTAEVIIDAKTGNEDRYADENEDMSTLAGELGSGTLVNGSTTEEPESESPENGLFDEMVGSGSTTTINGETADRKWVVVYASENDVDTGDLEDWVDANSDDGQFADVDDISYNQNGRMGIITGTSDTDDL